MNNFAKLFILICGISFFINVVYLLVKRKISEKNSILWLIGTVLILVLAVIPDTLDVIAYSIGIEYPPSMLFLLSTLVLLQISLHQSIQISALNEQIKELAQRSAVSEGVKKLENTIKKF